MQQPNPLHIRRIHHLELWVGNAKQAAYYYRHALGFSQIAYAGLETGQRGLASYVLEQGTARFVLTSPQPGAEAIGRHIERHGDGVRDIAFEVDDAAAAFHAAVERGAEPEQAPIELKGTGGTVHRAAIRTFGDTVHSLISYHGHAGPFLPGFVASPAPGSPAGIVRIDHVVGNVELGRMRHWADWYERVFGFQPYLTFDDVDISTEYTALMSVVMADRSHSIKLPLNEPAPGRRKSQIEEYLEFYDGPGVQHVALLTTDILATVQRLKENGVEFLIVPASYYERLASRVGPLEESLDELRSLGILVDRDDEGYLLQIFTHPVEDRPTLFFEIIQRRGSRGFGKGNFRALFEAIEREQERRGNLIST